MSVMEFSTATHGHLPCLTVHQPWAWAIFHSAKSIENRSWATKYRGPILIHAAATRDTLDNTDLRRWKAVTGYAAPSPDALHFGHIIGIVQLASITTPDKLKSIWADGPHCWQLTDPVAFSSPHPIAGKLGLWKMA